MKGRYLALIERDLEARGAIARISEEAARRFGLALVAVCGQARIYTDGEVPHLAGPAGDFALLGVLFRREGARSRIDIIDAGEERRIVESGCAALIERCWGGYLAFAANPRADELNVLRDPSGAIPCFRIDMAGFTYLASDVEIALGLSSASAAIDWRRVAQRLAFPVSRTGATCLRGVAATPPGTRLRFANDYERADSLWDPWTFASHDMQITNAGAAADMLVAEIGACTDAMAGLDRRPLIELSGGIDSSIVAACLVKRAPAATCVNLYCNAPGGDERRYASAVVERIGVRLRVAALDGAEADLRRVPAIRAPDPDANLLHEMIDTVMIEELKAAGADAFFSGGGGDNVFCFLSTASPAVDALLSGAGLGAFRGAVLDIAALHGSSLWTAAGYALRKTLLGGAIRQPRRDAFITREVLSAPPALNPWCEGPDGALPGKREHLTSITFGLWNADATERSRVAPVRYPLLAQPVVELCLRIPSWLWVAGGRDRALARRAFANALPDIVVRRRTKGDLTGFMMETFRRQRSLVRELLLDGRLAKEGIIDRRSVEASLSSDGALDQVKRGTLLTLAKAEVWAQGWDA